MDFALGTVCKPLVPGSRYAVTTVAEESAFGPLIRIKKLACEVFDAVGKSRLIDIDIAIELERIALEDEYFVKRKLQPNIDFYSDIIYQAMDLPMDMFPVLFAIGRSAGWLAQWREMLEDDEQKIARPRQIYLGEALRSYVPISERDTGFVARPARPTKTP